MSAPARVLSVIGTRPEAIKMLPVHRRLAADPSLHATLLNTGQHAEMLRQVLDVFGVTPDYELRLLRDDQSVPRLLARAIAGVERVLEQERPDLVLVQGDTTSALGAALAASCAGIPVGHVEAGLRTHLPREPFPEELNRRQIGAVAELHFAPTRRAVDNLLREGVPGSRVFLTGNTVVDALHEARALQALRGGAEELADLIPQQGRLIVATLHRRENWGAGVEEVCRALRQIVMEHEDLHVLFPIHPNPRLRALVQRRLSGIPRIRLLQPLPYLTFLSCLDRAALVLTDSGGVQEEAPSFGTPVLVLRQATERPEGVEGGQARVVGAVRGEIVEAVRLTLGAAAARSTAPTNPYGDGAAADRIAGHVRRFLSVEEKGGALRRSA